MELRLADLSGVLLVVQMVDETAALKATKTAAWMADLKADQMAALMASHWAASMVE